MKTKIALVLLVALFLVACQSLAPEPAATSTPTRTPTATTPPTNTPTPEPTATSTTKASDLTPTEEKELTLEEKHGDIAPSNPKFPYILGNVYSTAEHYGIKGDFKLTTIYPVFTGNFIERKWYHPGLGREITDALMETVLRDSDSTLHVLLISFFSPDLDFDEGFLKDLRVTDGKGSEGAIKVETLDRAKSFFSRGEQISVSIYFERPSGIIPKEKIYDWGGTNYESVKNYYLYLEQIDDIKKLAEILINGDPLVIPDDFVMPGGGQDVRFIRVDLDKFFEDYFAAGGS